MPKKVFTEEQIVAALRLAEAGTTLADVCRKYGVSDFASVQTSRPFTAGNVGMRASA